ncbi:MAG: hypothetical protein IPL52_07630 [Flavobacteriales bacterium]|nr:hypothetical protein [Flavobacteriales bacterium]
MENRRILLYATMALLAIVCSNCSGPVPSTTSVGGPGFGKAYFGKEMLENLMAVEGCEAVRIYNVRRTRDDEAGSAMAIPAEMYGRDLYNEEKRLYIYFDGLRGSDVLTGRFREAQAEEATDWVEAAGDSSYATNFGTDQVRALLAVEGCTAVQVKPETRSDGYYTMRLDPVSIKEGVATIVGDGSVYAVCGEPCPVYCGHMPSLYVHMRD